MLWTDRQMDRWKMCIPLISSPLCDRGLITDEYEVLHRCGGEDSVDRRECKKEDIK